MFERVLQTFTASEKDEVLATAKPLLINPRFRRPNTGNESMAELMIGDLSYDTFEKRCHELASDLSESTVVNIVVQLVLQYLYHASDDSRVDQLAEFYNEKIEHFAKTAEQEPEFAEHSQGLIQMMERLIDDLPDRIRRTRRLYDRFCEDVVTELVIRGPETLKKTINKLQEWAPGTF